MKEKDKFYFELPSIKRKKEILDYLNEFDLYQSDLNGSGFLDKVFEGYTFEEALNNCLRLQEEDFAKKMGRCQSKTFLLIRESDNRIIGNINIRWNLSKEMLQFGGHIGYSIRPTERRKGYNKINLYLGMIEAKKLGLDRVMLDCEATNIASDKTLKALGGKLERSEIDPSDGLLTNVYWFDVEKTIQNYQNIYEPYINKKEEK